MKYQHRNVAIATTYIWIGFVCAISFMEAWLKFKAPGITTKLGLGVGQLVFSALNKVEIVCALIIAVTIIITKIRNSKYLPSFSIYYVFVILIIQSVWLLPYLDTRANQIIKDIKVQDNGLHLVFVILEIIKVVSLFLFGLKSFRQSFKTSDNYTLNLIDDETC